MRLLYVAASRAEDRLILSGVTEEIATLGSKNDSWLKWIWQSLEFGEIVVRAMWLNSPTTFSCN